MTRAWVLMALALVGCGGAADPCQGITGCITARVEGTVVGLDSLRVTVGGASAVSAAGGSFDLPVQLAIVPPAGAGSPLTVTVDGLTSGVARATSGPESVPFNPAGHTAFTFTLIAGNGGDGGPGDGANLDGPPPGVVSFFPASLDYGTVDRGATGASRVITLFNNTAGAVTTTASPQPTGDLNDWSIDATKTTCFAADAGMSPVFTVPAGGNCTIGFQFAPQKSGMLKMDVMGNFDDGESASFSLTGTARPAWSAEAVGSSNLTGVWGASPTDLWAVGGMSVYRSSGDGHWNAFGNTFVVGATFGIFGVDPTHVWVAADGFIFLGGSGGTFTKQTPPTTTNGYPLTVWARDATTAFAPTDSPNPQILALSGSAWSTSLPADALHAFSSMCGFGSSMVAVGASGMVYATDVNHALQNLGSVLGSYASTLRGCWMPDANNAWLVGDAGSAAIGIFHCSFNNSVWTCNHETAGSNTNNLNAVSGRVDPGSGKPDLYAVGPLGNLLLRSDGTGTWTPVQLPSGSAMQSVWVATNGDVVAVGGNGVVNHFY